MNISEITNLYNVTSSDDDKILDYLTECINLNKKPDMLLTESILYSEYEILFEATSEIIDAQHEINNLTKNIKSEKDYTKKVALLDKLSDSFKKLVNWWYKIDPNKKFKTLHFILNLSTSILLLLFTFKSLILPILLTLVIESGIFINMAIPYYTGKEMMFLGYLILLHKEFFLLYKLLLLLGHLIIDDVQIMVN